MAGVGADDCSTSCNDGMPRTIPSSQQFLASGRSMTTATRPGRDVSREGDLTSLPIRDHQLPVHRGSFQSSRFGLFELWPNAVLFPDLACKINPAGRGDNELTVALCDVNCRDISQDSVASTWNAAKKHSVWCVVLAKIGSKQ